MLLWRKLNLLVTSSSHLLEGYIVHQMRFCVDDLSDKSENYIERGHSDGKRNKRIYSGLTNFQQSQISQLKMMT